MSGKKTKQNKPVKPESTKTKSPLEKAGIIVGIIVGILTIIQRLLEIFHH